MSYHFMETLPFFVLCSDSTGGNLAADVLLISKELNGPKISGQIEGMAYSTRLIQEGNIVENFYEKELVHGYFTNVAVFSENIKRTITRISEF
ncbi:hypothetical protein [Gottfriedia acidiceleris]|uniref:hypothetical protein n=1 Tax=Gottfriedia acidiceleris TaxID=371036 RepID=UPI003D20329C